MSTQSLQNVSLLVYTCNVPPFPCPRCVFGEYLKNAADLILAKINPQYTAFSPMLGLKGDTTVHTERSMRWFFR